MNKKLFSWKALAGLALLVAMGLTSCTSDAVDNEDPAKKPSTEPTSSVVIDGDNVTVTAIAPSDITAALKKLTAAGTRGESKEYNVLINTASMKVTAADCIISIPEVSDATWNFVFDGAYAKDEAILVMEDDALDFVNIYLPEAAYKGFELDMPYSTVEITGDGAIGELVVDMDEANVREYNKRQTIGNRRVTLSDNIFVKGLNWINGGVVLADDAVIDAYIAGLHPNRGFIAPQTTYNAKGFVTKTENKNISVENVDVAEKGGIIPVAFDRVNNVDVIKYEVCDEDGNEVLLKNLIIRETDAWNDGTEDFDDYGYVSVNSPYRKYPIDLIQVEDGARLELVAVNPDEHDNWTEDVAQALRDKNYNLVLEHNTYAKWNRHYWVNEIEGLGNGTGIVALGNNGQAFNNVESVKNITYSSMIFPWDVVPNEAYINGSYGGWGTTIYSNLEKVTFDQFTTVVFQGGFDEIKSSKFPVAGQVLFNIMAGDALYAYSFNYNACEFLADARLGANTIFTDDILYDENGDPITYTVWDYAKVNAAGTGYVYEANTTIWKWDKATDTYYNADPATGTPYDDVDDVVNYTVTTDEVADILHWDYIWGYNAALGLMEKLYTKDGVYAVFKEAKNPGASNETWVGNVCEVSKNVEWEYNQAIDYKDIPLLARKDGLVNSREVYAMENQREINDMLILTTLTGSKLGGKAITSKTSMNASQPQYFNGNNGRNDAKMTYRYDIGGTIYRNAFDNVGQKWLFIKVG